MTVQAVCGDIQLTIGEPFNPEVILTKTGIIDLGKGLNPVNLLRFFRSKCFRLLNGMLVTFEIVCFRDSCRFFEFIRHWVDVFHSLLPWFFISYPR